MPNNEKNESLRTQLNNILEKENLSSPEQREKAQNIIQKSIYDLINKFPDIGYLLSLIHKEVDDSIESLGICFDNKQKVFQFKYNPTWVINNTKYVTPTIAEEIIHLCYYHPVRVQNKQHKEVYNIAADLTVNELLGKSFNNKELKNYITIDKINYYLTNMGLIKDNSFGLQYNQTSDEYYEDLCRILKPSNNNNNNNGNSKGNKDGKATDELSNNHEWSKDDPDNDSGEISAKIYANSLNELIKQADEMAFGNSEDNQHNLNRGYGLSEALAKAINLSEQLLETSWNRVLKNYLGSIEKRISGYSWKKEHKRFPDFPGVVRKPRLKIGIAIDTSGSIKDEDFQEFILQLKNIGSNPSFEVWVTLFDTNTKGTYQYKGKDLGFRHFHGGGTDYEPVMDKFLKDKKFKDADIFLVLTDGECNEPHSITKLRKPLKWILTPQHNLFFFDFKRSIIMKEKGGIV